MNEKFYDIQSKIQDSKVKDATKVRTRELIFHIP